ncbi:conserved hypothetical protein [Lodderomyces elongisporus NRRL YB-4239]|uniref:Uncharacterized protein n=1 Tax=Lodderomyces elongisporus (strain ATCC 11503 / CBS 2605 / JCM 1781 / NBRC 1676 / NRRL YB-4239) TaxID=379508 RepID=A5E0J7_LODEL|nr:conserved hypothetical protein [Lodderomyces elongisporus NRRL YB-4239]
MTMDTRQTVIDGRTPDAAKANTASNTSTTQTNKPKQSNALDKMRDALEEETNIYTRGVKNADVDWFMRDSNMDPNIALPTHRNNDNDNNTTTTTTTNNNNNNNSALDSSLSSNGHPQSPSRTHSSTPSHLNTSISNSNASNATKTKPSISPIQEEAIGASSPPRQRTPSCTDSVKLRRRSTGGGGIGLFSKLKSKFHKDSNEGIPTTNSASRAHIQNSNNNNNNNINSSGLFKANYDMANPSNESSTTLASSSSSSSSTTATTATANLAQNQGPGHLHRSVTNPVYSSNTKDPRLEEYIKFYQQKDIRRASIASRRSSVASGKSDTTETLPSALANPYENVTYNQHPTTKTTTTTTNTTTNTLSNNHNQSESATHSSKKPGFFKKFSSSTTSTQDANSTLQLQTILPLPLLPKPAPAIPTVEGVDLNPSFKGLKPLKRVAFHSSTFLIDPPQQIPSRNPRKGNVEVLPGGVVHINPLTEEDKIAIEKSQLGLGGGIVVGGSGALGYIKKDAPPPQSQSSSGSGDEDETENIESSNSSKSSDENENENENGSDNKTEPEAEPAVSARAKGVAIDKPMIRHHPVNYTAPVEKMALDKMYSRCCHLREILPIPAILKQIPPGSLAPLPVLQLRNPTPTMIEIQTFADFLRIAPIICVSLDGVSLSVEQFKIILSAMSAKKQLEKLSLRNTPISEEGWSLLCWFLSRNTVLNKLDVTQCPALSVNILKKKKKRANSGTTGAGASAATSTSTSTSKSTATKKKPEEELVRMTCNKENRSDVDWSLFVATLVARGGIDELILTGCCITDVDVFRNLMELAVLKRTTRLGLAFNNLSPKHLKIVVDTWLFRDFARGLDLGYNDFSNVHMLKIFLDFIEQKDFEQKILSKATLSFLSLNSTNSVFNDTFKEVFEKVLLRLPNLKYLDFSNNQRLFNTFNKVDRATNHELITSYSDAITHGSDENQTVQYFTSKLPLFPKLIRLHLENENFSQQSIQQIAKVIPFCKNLGYFSLLGNHVDLTSASTLVNAVKNSKTIINLECNTDSFPELFKERIGLYTMRNMERLLYASQPELKSKTDGSTPPRTPASPSLTSPPTSSSGANLKEMTETKSLTEQLNDILLLKARQKLDLQSPEVQQFLSKAQAIRGELKESINGLLSLQLKNELDVDGKETLIRFIFIDSSIEKGLQLIDPSLVGNKSMEANMYLVKNGEGQVKTRSNDFESGASRDKYVSNTGDGDADTTSYGQLSPPSASNVPISKSPLASKSNSRTNLAALNREEGSVLKLSKLKDYHRPSTETEVLGEDLRKKLMSIELSDLDKVIEYLSDLKKKGISLEKAFQRHVGENNVSTHDERDILDIEGIRQRLQSLKAKALSEGQTPEAGSVKDTKTKENKGDDPNTHLSEGGRTDLSDTYDQVLNSLTN